LAVPAKAQAVFAKSWLLNLEKPSWTQRAAIASAPVANAKTAEEECRIPVWFEVEEQPETPEFSCYPKKDGSKWVCASDHDLRCGMDSEDGY
jgi:hypothetical protein